MLEPDSFNLRVSLDCIDELIERRLKDQQTAISPPAGNNTERVDRTLVMDATQQARLIEIDAVYLEEWQQANGEWELQRLARAKQQQAKIKLRSQVIEQYAAMDVKPGNTLVYGGVLPGAVCLDVPDGQQRSVERLIHFSHPVNGDELWLRECRVQAERVIRYRVPGLDDAQWMMQDEGRSGLDAAGYREILKQRLNGK